MFARIIIAVCLAWLAACYFSSPAAEPPANAPAPPPASAPWQITAKPAAASVRQGGDVKIDLTIKNISSANQTIEMPQTLWYAHSDNPSIEFFSWPKHGGLGPVIVFKSTTLKPGETLSHAWTAKIPATAKLGPTKFRIGISLHRSPSTLEWSEPADIDITADK